MQQIFHFHFEVTGQIDTVASFQRVELLHFSSFLLSQVCFLLRLVHFTKHDIQRDIFHTSANPNLFQIIFAIVFKMPRTSEQFTFLKKVQDCCD